VVSPVLENEATSKIDSLTLNGKERGEWAHNRLSMELNGIAF
jgi:hypothetical protein